MYSERGASAGNQRPNKALEWTLAGWPHAENQLIIVSRGQPASSPQLQRSS